MKTIYTKTRRFAALAPAVVLITASFSHALAQDTHQHAQAQTEQAADQTTNAQTLVKMVRAATDRYQNVSVAQAEGYALNFGCVSGDENGAMGMHFVNGDLVNSGVIDVSRPQIVIYEKQADGSLKLIGADYLVLADVWNKAHSAPPQLMGQLFHLFTSPNRFGLPAFYTLHVWAWKHNPNGAFVNWHPNVSCAQFNGQQ
jgi:hypothetical protein